MDEATSSNMDPHHVVLRPLVTEKGTHQSEKYNAYAFQVHPRATKQDVRQAVEALWDVRVVAVNTMNYGGKSRRRAGTPGVTASWKKAIVTLRPDDKIELI